MPTGPEPGGGGPGFDDPFEDRLLGIGHHEVGNEPAIEAHEVVMAAGEGLVELEADELVGAVDRPDRSHCLQHRQVAVDGALRQPGGGHDVGNGQRPAGGGQDGDKRLPAGRVPLPGRFQPVADDPCRRRAALSTSHRYPRAAGGVGGDEADRPPRRPAR